MHACNIFWCGKYHQNWENDLHSHNYFQLVVILSGSGTVWVDDVPYEISKEQAYLFLPLVEHAIFCGKKDAPPLQMLDIKFAVNHPLLFADLSKLGNMLTLGDFSWFTHKFDKIIEESARQKPFYSDVTNAYLLEMLVHIVREQLGIPERTDGLDTPVSDVPSYKGMDVRALMEYIDFNYSHIISLEDLSRLAGVNKTTLISIFKEIYGTTPIRYINNLRLRKAKALLENSDLSISEIAELVGFQSIHYFSRFFKAKENCTPMEFRMGRSQSRYFTFPSPDGHPGI